MKDKKKIIIIGLIILIIVLIIYLIIKKNRIEFYLNGDEQIVVRYGTTFSDPGAVAIDGFGNDISDAIKSYGEVNTHILGMYRIVYEIDYHGLKTIERTVLVQSIPIDDLEIKLNGDDIVYILKDNYYIEDGANVYSKTDNFLLDNETINITTNLDTKRVGTYDVNYELSDGKKSVQNTRKVIVFDIDYIITPEELTSEKVEIDLDLSNIKDYLNVKLPTGEIVRDKYIEYEVDTNDEYEFIVSLTNNKSFTKVVTVDNIIGNYTCRGEITTTGTKISVIPTTDIIDFKWYVNGNTFTSGSVFNRSSLINNASVELIFEDGRNHKINCNIEDKLIYHFKYDENNTKPFMRKNTYTAADKAKYDAMLKQVVSEAGYGSRAGVVAAARFLVGALDYKVPYQGASYYRRVGLNIGQSGAWGSSGVGLDCYAFVSWARKQNGLGENALYAGDKYKTADEVNRIRVGDYLLTPCTTADCKNPYRINHIALVIGVDSNYIYVAEAKTAGVNALVVTKIDKKNPPTRYNLSIVKHEKYASEGNVTDMWM